MKTIFSMTMVFGICALCSGGACDSQPMPVVSYTALSDAAKASGQLSLYKDGKVKRGSVKLGGYVLDYSVPQTARAYDVIPIQYTLRQPAGARRVAVEAVGFEDNKNASGKALYDMAIPGDLRVKVDYLGSVCADRLDGDYIPLSADPKTPVSPFPPYKRQSLVCSSTIKESETVWFKFRLTNTGNTILDPEGFGAWFQEPRLVKLGNDGSEKWSLGTVNIYQRQLRYLYPGDSEEMWVNFFSPNIGGDYTLGLVEGHYRIDLKFLYRWYSKYHWGINIWGGKEFAQFELPINVTEFGANTPVNSQMRYAEPEENMPGYFESFEEFMSSFRIWSGVSKPTVQRGVIYLQVAPWTKQVTMKLILTDPRKIAVATTPIQITDETLKIEYNPKNVMVVDDNGTERPAVIAQAMPGMRSGFQLGPYPEEHMLREIEEMKSLGVNVIANTSGNWYLSEMIGRKWADLSSACYKYWYDALVRKVGMKLLGWSIYPPSSPSWYENVGPLLGKDISYTIIGGGYNNATECVDLGDPIVSEVIAAWAKYNYARWGDVWFQTKDGRIPVDVEDTWGWMRDDINDRYPLGPLALNRFRDWVKSRYGTIEKTNEAWGSDYKDFAGIDPQTDQKVFFDWNRANEDWDTFRTQLRMEIYRKADEIIRKTIPQAELSPRCEGANLTIKADGKSPDMHLRHVYYSQRRNAMLQDVVNAENVIHFFSDYTTMPYTVNEWRQAMREMVSAGIMPMFMPQFDHMRDVLLNPYYGQEYQTHYNLDAPSNGIVVHCLMAAYPWWKATYEEGGAPGIIWSDYLCDGFATQTQKQELKLLKDNFDKMIISKGAGK
ncbi:MAG: beta-galactosidase [Armatimonadota bacterium]